LHRFALMLNEWHGIFDGAESPPVMSSSCFQV